MQRLINQSLKDWAHAKRRKPLILRGARQVGKTYAVKALAVAEFQQQLVTIDFEKTPLLPKNYGSPKIRANFTIGNALKKAALRK